MPSINASPDNLLTGVTNNIQLSKLGYELFGNDYIGTWSSDEMPKYIKEGQCFILNTDSLKSRRKTGHWVALFKLKNRLLYYDSYARPAYKLSKFWATKRMYNANTTLAMHPRYTLSGRWYYIFISGLGNASTVHAKW